jgi:hypothetical protein
MSKRTKKPSWRLPTADEVGTTLTAIMGIVVPLLSASLCSVAGDLCSEDGGPVVAALAIAGLVLTGCVLAVSLDHLKWAIGNITRSGWWSSWALAISLDVTLMFSELVLVYGPDKVRTRIWAIMVTVCLLSVCLNIWAFFRQPEKAQKASQKSDGVLAVRRRTLSLNGEQK